MIGRLIVLGLLVTLLLCAQGTADNLPATLRRLQDTLRQHPPAAVESQTRLALAGIYQRQGDWWSAAAEWRRLRQLAPQEPEYAYQLGLVYQHLSKWAFDRLQAVGPQSARLHQMLGEQYSITGESGKAISAFRRAIAADPHLPGSHLALAILYLRLSQPREALAEIDQELTIAPESAVAQQVRRSLQEGPP